MGRTSVAGATGGTQAAFISYMIKRFFDLAVSIAVILCILSWLMPVLALLILLDSGGPVFFVQKRVGRQGRPFNCYKLRSMAAGSITRCGGWLRRSHLDELPQFFNVLLGSMSLVGPRPYMPSDCRVFADMVDDPDSRHRVKPGITGMAQSKGLHETSCDPDIVRQRYYWDNWYVENAGWLLDLRILGRTALNLFPRDPAAVPGSPFSASDRISVLPLEKRKAPMRG
jgi:putative colanic acid biosynthesis UDP-glucose lipid carrier transferase